MSKEELEVLCLQLHRALNDITAEFIARVGYDYHAVDKALKALDTSWNAFPNAPLTLALILRIEAKKARE